MPISETFLTTEEISLTEFISKANQISNMGEAEGLWELAEDFARLGNNRKFLSEFYCNYIKNNIKKDPLYIAISQAVVLHRSENYYIRANFWPLAEECSAEELRLFAYDQPHDHNFDLLSYSYCGDGYVSDDFNYDYSTVIGYQGEVIDINPLGSHKHECGNVLMYYCNKDIHVQHPPLLPSITLNVIPLANQNGLLDQYFFKIDDVNARKAVLIHRATNIIEQRRIYLSVVKQFISENTKDVISDIIINHVCPRTRYEAIRLMASIDKCEHERLTKLINSNDSPLLKYYLNTLDAKY